MEGVRKVVRAPHFQPKQAHVRKPSAEAALGSIGFFLYPWRIRCALHQRAADAHQRRSQQWQQGHLQLRQGNKLPSSLLKPKRHISCVQLLNISISLRLMIADLAFECWKKQSEPLKSRGTVSLVVFLWYFFFLRNRCMAKRTTVTCMGWWSLLR